MIIPENYNFLEFAVIDSSNEEAKRLIKSGSIKQDTVILARSQTAGHGRYGRVWQSPLGNLYTSIIIKTEESWKSEQISFVVAVAVGAVVEDILPKCSINYKWPNDILINGRKTSGILLEKIDNWLVIGIGINIETIPDSVAIPVTSLKNEGAYNIDADEILQKLLYFFNKSLKMWKNSGFSSIRGDWVKKAWKIGQEIKVNLGNETFSGTFTTISEDGVLEVEVSGEKRLVTAGEVFFS